MLSGLTPPTRGDAIIFGLRLQTQLYEIKKIMGVCPQHDILFEELTAVEHIQLYAGLKGVHKKEINALVKERLEAVKLFTVKDNLVHTYSGGSK